MDAIDKITAQWNQERPDLDVGPMALIGRLKRLAAHLSREQEKTFDQHGLNSATFDVLATLRRSGAPYRLSPSELLATMMITSGTMTNRIDQLCKLGLVQRHENPDDARSVFIGLTDDGLRVINTAVTQHVATQHRLLEAMPVAEKSALNALLANFLAKFE